MDATNLKMHGLYVLISCDYLLIAGSPFIATKGQEIRIPIDDWSSKCGGGITLEPALPYIKIEKSHLVIDTSKACGNLNFMYGYAYT